GSSRKPSKSMATIPIPTCSTSAPSSLLQRSAHDGNQPFHAQISVGLRIRSGTSQTGGSSRYPCFKSCPRPEHTKNSSRGGHRKSYITRGAHRKKPARRSCFQRNKPVGDQQLRKAKKKRPRDPPRLSGP